MTPQAYSVAKQLPGPMQRGREGRQTSRSQPPQQQSSVKQDYTKSQTATQQCTSLRGRTTKALPSPQPHTLIILQQVSGTKPSVLF